MKTSSTAGLKVLAWLGAITIVGIVLVVPRLFFIMQVARQSAVQETQTPGGSNQLPNEPLGKEGSHCGGHYRLPCEPGLSCTHIDNSDTGALGICVRGDAGTATSTIHVQPLTDPNACGASRGCSVGKYCKADDLQGNGTCAPMDATAPLVASVKITGMSLENGWYRAAPGTSATVTVETMNAVTVDMYLVVPDQSSIPIRAPIGTMKKGKNGEFTGVFNVSKGMSAQLLVIARAKDASSSSASLEVASTQ